jgi:cytochrome P450
MTDLLDDTPTFPMPRDYPLNPPPELYDVQSNRPVSRVRLWNGSQPWLVTRYEDVKQALASPRLSASTHVSGYPHWNAGNQAMKAQVTTFINMDDPDHSRQRRAVAPQLLVKRMQELRPRIQEIVDRQIDVLLSGPHPADFVERFALPIPSLVICEFLGVPYQEHDLFQDISTTLLGRSSDPSETVRASQRLHEYLAGLIDSPDLGEGLLRQLITEQLDTGAMSRDEIVAIADLILIAGHETTANMIGLSTLALLRQPDQLAALRADPGLAGTAVDEMLRYLTILHFGVLRQVTEDLPVGDETIKAGEWLVAALSSGNRDESVFPDPDRIDLQRGASAHLAFGYGIHQCLGQQLARVELQEVFARLHQRIPTLRLAVPFEEIEFKNDALVYGVRSLPVTWDKTEGDNR